MHLNNCVHRAGFLAKSAINTFCHINVITRRSTTSIRPCFGFNCDSLKMNCFYFNFYLNYLRRTNCLAEFAGNAALFPRRISTKRVFTPEARTERAFLERIIYCTRLHKHMTYDGRTS